MKGTPEVIAVLNELLVEYHTSLVQFIQYSISCSLYGYKDSEKKFDHMFRKDEECLVKLIKRISFLGGISTVGKVNEFDPIETVEDMLNNAVSLKLSLIGTLTNGIEVAMSFKDYGTRSLLERMLVEEDENLSTIEAALIQFSERGKA
jgi:bacterioferritin